MATHYTPCLLLNGFNQRTNSVTRNQKKQCTPLTKTLFSDNTPYLKYHQVISKMTESLFSTHCIDPEMEAAWEKQMLIGKRVPT